MNYSELCTADTALLGLGRGACGKVLGYDKRFYLTKTDFTFADSAASKSDAAWDAGVLAGSIFPFPEVQEIEPQNVDATFWESPAGATFKTKEEKRKTLYKFIENISVHAGMKSYDGKAWRVFILTEKGYLKGHARSDGKVEGLPLSNFYVNAQTTATIGDAPEESPVVLEYADVNDWDKEYFVAKMDGSHLLNLEAPYELNIMPETATAGSTFVFDMNVATGDGTPVTGLVVADFILKDASGTEVTIDSVTADGSIDGKYTVTATDAMTSGTFSVDGIVEKTDVMYQSKDYPVAS